MAGPIPRVFVSDANGAGGSYYSVEEFLNELTVVLLATNTKKALAVALVDSAGSQVAPTSPGTAVVSGTTTVTTAGTAVRITATPTTIKGVWLNADLIAGIIVTVGDSAVVGNATGMKGVVLTPGNQPIFLNVTDLSLLYVDAQSNGGKLSWLTVS